MVHGRPPLGFFPKNGRPRDPLWDLWELPGVVPTDLETPRIFWNELGS